MCLIFNKFSRETKSARIMTVVETIREWSYELKEIHKLSELRRLIYFFPLKNNRWQKKESVRTLTCDI